MQYDPIKNILARYVSRNTFLRKIFYMMLGLIFLREWYVKRKINQIYSVILPNYILDAGSGFGQYSYFMAKRFPDAEITAVDVKEDQVNDCNYFFKKEGFKNVNFSVADLTLLNESNKYDFILSVDVMEHIQDDTGVFKRFYESLKSNGRLMINTPSDQGGSDADNEHDSSFIEEHVRNGYSKKDITEKLSNAGFKIESFEYTYGPWGNLYWRLGIKYPMLLLNVSKLFIVLLPFYYILTIVPILLFMFLDIGDRNKPSGTGILVVGIKH